MAIQVGSRVMVERIDKLGWRSFYANLERFLNMEGTVRHVRPDDFLKYTVDMDNGEKSIRFNESELLELPTPKKEG